MKRSLSLEEQNDIETEKRLKIAARVAEDLPQDEDEYAAAIKKFEVDQGVNKSRMPVFTTKNLGVETRQAQRAKMIIEVLEEHGQVGRRELAKMIGCNLASVPDYVRMLIANKTVTRLEGGKSGSSYILTEEINGAA